MTTDVHAAADSDHVPPTRYRSAEQRSRRIGRPLKVFGRVRDVDEQLMDRIARGFTECDEVGDALAAAMRSRGSDRVTMRQFQQALEHGVDSVPGAPPALRTFFDTVEDTPTWVDLDLVNEGARVYRRYGRNGSDVLLQLALLGGYRFGGPSDLLVATGGLSGDTTRRRLGETQQWAIAASRHDGMRRDGDGWRLTVHVRLMHALVNHRFSEGDRWDTARWGRPINQADQAATLGLFDGALLLGVRALGVPVSRDDSRAVMHLWRYLGWLMGVDEDWLVDTERDRARLNYHILLAQADVTPAGTELARSIVQAQRELDFGRFDRWQRRYAPERLLSMLRPFLGTQGLRDLGLPVRVPWAVGPILLQNVVLYRLIGRTGPGERLLQWRSRRNSARLMRQYFGADHPAVADLDV